MTNPPDPGVGGVSAPDPHTHTGAVDALIATWAQVVMDQHWGCGCCADSDDELRAETVDTLQHFARALAEKIRAERYIHDCCPECSAAATAAAELIDPHRPSAGPPANPTGDR